MWRAAPLCAAGAPEAEAQAQTDPHRQETEQALLPLKCRQGWKPRAGWVLAR